MRTFMYVMVTARHTVNSQSPSTAASAKPPSEAQTPSCPSANDAKPPSKAPSCLSTTGSKPEVASGVSPPALWDCFYRLTHCSNLKRIHQISFSHSRTRIVHV